MTPAELTAAKHEAFCNHEDAVRAAFEAAMRGDKAAAKAKAIEVRKCADEMQRLNSFSA